MLCHHLNGKTLDIGLPQVSPHRPILRVTLPENSYGLSQGHRYTIGRPCVFWHAIDTSELLVPLATIAFMSTAQMNSPAGMQSKCNLSVWSHTCEHSPIFKTTHVVFKHPVLVLRVSYLTTYSTNVYSKCLHVCRTLLIPLTFLVARARTRTACFMKLVCLAKWLVWVRSLLVIFVIVWFI